MVAWQKICCHALLKGKNPLDSFCLIEDFCLSNSKGQSILIIFFFFFALYVNFRLQTGRKESCFLNSGHAECLPLTGGVSWGWPFPWGTQSASSPFSCRFCVALWGQALGACVRQHGRHFWVPVWALTFRSWSVSFLWLFGKLPQPWWLKAAQIYLFTVLEAAGTAAKSLQSCVRLCVIP